MLFCVNLSLIVCFVGWFVTQQWCIHRLFGGKAVAFRRRAGGIPPKGQWRFGRIVVRYGRYRGHLLCFLRLDLCDIYVYAYKSLIYKIAQECVIFGQRDGWLKMTSFWESGCKVFLMTPYHHHLEKLGWIETDIVKLFWTIGLVLSMGAIIFGVWL